jgi:hypothetical protein
LTELQLKMKKDETKGAFSPQLVEIILDAEAI